MAWTLTVIVERSVVLTMPAAVLRIETVDGDIQYQIKPYGGGTDALPERVTFAALQDNGRQSLAGTGMVLDCRIIAYERNVAAYTHELEEEEATAAE